MGTLDGGDPGGYTVPVARPPRIVVPGGMYHVTSRGNSQGVIFIDDYDRHYFLKLLAKVVERYGWICLSFCLLTNHYHLLVRIDEPNLSCGMQHLLWRYALYFNRRHGRTNHLVGERFHDELVEDQAHFFRLIAYVALNPVDAGLVARPEDWRWSSYGMTIRVEAPHSCLSVPEFLAYFDRDPDRARRRVRAIVEGELAACTKRRGHVPVTVTGT